MTVTKLQIHLTVLFLIMIIIISSYYIITVKRSSENDSKEFAKRELVNVARIMASQIDTDLHQTLKPGDEGSKDYFEIVNRLNEMKSDSENILYVYTMIKDGDYAKFIVDADYPNDVADIKEIYYEATPELFQGFEKPISENDFTTDEWGTVLSGYAPFFDSEGNSVGLVGVDMDPNIMFRNQREILNKNIRIISTTIVSMTMLFFIICGIMINKSQKIKSVDKKKRKSKT